MSSQAKIHAPEYVKTLSLSADEDPRVRSLADRLLGKLFVLGGADIVAQCLPDGETLDAVAHWTENICFDSESLQDETRLSDIVRCSRLQALTGCLGNNAIAGMLGMNNVIALCARRVFDACAQVRREVANVLVEVSGFEFDSQLCHGVCEELIFAATAAFEDATTSAVDNFARERVCVLDLAWHVIGVKEFLPLHALLVWDIRVCAALFFCHIFYDFPMTAFASTRTSFHRRFASIGPSRLADRLDSQICFNFRDSRKFSDGVYRHAHHPRISSCFD